MGVNNCKASTEAEYWEKCVPETFREQISEVNAKRYRQYLKKWRENDPEYAHGDSVIFGCRWAKDYYGINTGILASWGGDTLFSSSNRAWQRRLWCVGPYIDPTFDEVSANKDEFACYHTPGTWNEAVILNYQMAREHMKEIMMIDDDVLDEIWWLFYFPPEHRTGREVIEREIARVNPGPAAEAWLRTPRSDKTIQTRFQLMNEPFMSVLVFNAFDSWGLFLPYELSAQDLTEGELMNQVNSYFTGLGGKSCGGSGCVFGLDMIQGVTASPLEVETTIKRSLRATSKIKSGSYGDPLWTYSQRRWAARKILPEWDGENFLDAWHKWFIAAGMADNNMTFEEATGGKITPGKANPYTTPGYTGDLPHLPQYLIENAEPWQQSYALDPNAEGFRDPCLKRTTLETVVPIAAGVAAGVVAVAFVPGDLPSLAAGVTLGGSAYFTVSNTYGYDAFVRAFDNAQLPPIMSGKDNMTPEFLGVGGPVTGVLLLDHFGALPAAFQSNVTMTVAGVGAAGYFVLTPYLRDVVKIGDKFSAGLLSPLSLIDKGISRLFSGCYTVRSSQIGKCLCANAHQKPQLISNLMDVMGVTGEQRVMRTQCMRAAMTRGAWGTDPVRIGDCLENGTKSNPGACLTAGEWAYKRFPEEDEGLNTMYDEIKHCMQVDNLSFLPPLPADAPCAQHGPHFRMIGGECKNTSAPVGLQDPGQWPDSDTGVASDKSNDSCTIL